MKKILLTFLLLIVFLFMIGCEKKEYISASYTLSSAKIGTSEKKSDFTLFNVVLNKDGSMEVRIVYQTNILISRNSTYYISDGIIHESYNGENYSWNYSKDYITYTFVDYESSYFCTLLVVNELNESGVTWESVLFGQDCNDTKKYNYCPAIIKENVEGTEKVHIWYCCNKKSGIIVDYIGYRVGTLRADNKWEFSDEQIVLEPTSSTWDSRHTCDPSVVGGEFAYKGETYSYLMAYLGCTTEDYQRNETGIAVSKSLGGPWVKIDEINPIVPWYDDGDYNTELTKYNNMQSTSSIYWGTGMPSLISVDKKGKVLLFYQSTLRGCGIRYMDLSDLENPVTYWTKSLTKSGFLNQEQTNSSMSIPDFVYDEVTHRFYVVATTNKKNPPDVTKTLVASHCGVAYIPNVASADALVTLLFNGSYSWTMLGYVGPNETGWERNHNPGIVKDAYSRVYEQGKIEVIVSTGHNSWANENIFTYRLHGWTFNLNN